jgi:hypothetical protein
VKGRFIFFARFLVILTIGLGQTQAGYAQGLALSLTNAPNTATLTWPLTNYYSVLQSSTNLAGTNAWITEAIAAPLPYTGPMADLSIHTPTFTTNGMTFVSPAFAPQKFYRLNSSYFVPLTSFAIFYNGLLEFTMVQTMIINGPVHANGPIYVGSDDTLTFNGTVTTTSALSAHADDGNGPWVSLSAANVTFKSIPQSITNVPSLAVSSSQTNLHFMIEVPPNPTTLPGLITEQLLHNQRLYNQAQMLLLVTNASTGPVNATNVTVTLILQTSVNGALPGDDPGKVVYAYTNVSPDELTLGIANVAPNLPFLSLTNWFYDQREYKTNFATQIDVGLFASWAITNGFVQSKLPTNAGIYPTILYVADLRTNDAKHMPVVRLLDGAQLPANNNLGFSVATPNPLYVLGNYNIQIPGSSGVSANSTNTIYTVPAALFSDALTILSSNWTDAESLFAYSGGNSADDATTTTINAAIVTGSMPSTGTTVQLFSGGVHNLPRLLEDWNNQTLWLNTSLVRLWTSQIATNQFRDPQGFSPPPYNPYYNPPTRQFSFNLNYRYPTNTPPGIPFISLGGSMNP